MGPCTETGVQREEEEVRSVFYSLVTSLVYRLKHTQVGSVAS